MGMNFDLSKKQVTIMYCHPEDVDIYAGIVARAQAGEGRRFVEGKAVEIDGFYIMNVDSIEDVRGDPSIQTGRSECRYVDV